MGNGIVVIDFEDISAAIQIAAGLPAYKIYTFDPVLVDAISKHNLKNIELLTWDDCPHYADLEAWAHAAAFEMEAALDDVVRTITPDLSIIAWQHLNLYYLLRKLKWYTGLWAALAQQLAGVSIHLFICDRSSVLNSNSFIPSLLLIQHLQRHNIEFSGYVYGEETDDTKLIPNLLGHNSYGSKAETILTHLPTCFDDIHHFNAELRASGKTCINIKSRQDDLPVHAETDIPLMPLDEALDTFPEPIKKKIDDFHRVLADKINTLLAQYIDAPFYRNRQTEHIANTYTSQLVTYFLLNRHFQHTKPAKILLSDRDRGFHGPLVSFAKNHHLPVLLLAHTKTTNDMAYKYKNIVSLSHPMQGENVRDANGKVVQNYPLAYPETFSGSSNYPTAIKKIALLLNSPSENGIYFTRYPDYIQGIKKIIQWGKRNEIEILPRCKPSHPMIKLLTREAGLNAESLLHNTSIPMSEYARSCDLCLMFDTPTPDVIEFLGNAIPILNPTTHGLSAAESTLVNADVVPRANVGDTLHRVNGFLSDLDSFFLFRNQQFYRYVSLFQQARPLRTHV